jgi:hypothetical protein
MAVLAQRLYLLASLILLIAGSPSLPEAADNLQLHEQEIKAGLLYNFLKYTTWPAPSSSMAVCVFGADPFEGYLQPMAGRSVNQMEITLHFVRDVQETGSCNLVFVNADEKGQWPELQKFLARRSILTVSDFEGFTDSGGMIEFTRRNEHVSVDLNIEAVTSAHLHVQDRLLKLVTVVHSGVVRGR